MAPTPFPINRKYRVSPALARAFVDLRRAEGERFAPGFDPAPITELSAVSLTRVMAAALAERGAAGLATSWRDLVGLGFAPEQISELRPHAETLAVANLVGSVESLCAGAEAPVQFEDERPAKQLADELAAEAA